MTKKHLFLGSGLLLLYACATPKQEQTSQLELHTILKYDTVNTQANIHHSHIRAGVGRFFDSEGHDIEYMSGVINIPLQGESSFTAMGHAQNRLQSDINDASTLQAAYGLNKHWNIGGGLLHFSGTDNDTLFGRVLYTHKTDDLEFLVGGLVKEIANDIQPGLSGILSFLDVGGFQPVLGMQQETEQARYTAGIIFPSFSSQSQEKSDLTIRLPNLQPAIDVLYVDNNVGDNPGPQFVLGNFTLGYNGKFFPTKAKIGRLLGATGIWEQNPIFGTDSSVTHHFNFNRVIDPAVMGNFLNVQYSGFKKPTGDKAEHIDALVFPTQFDSVSSPLDRFFVGLSYDSFGEEHSIGPLFGAIFDFAGIYGNFNIAAYEDQIVGSISGVINF